MLETKHKWMIGIAVFGFFASMYIMSDIHYTGGVQKKIQEEYKGYVLERYRDFREYSYFKLYDEISKDTLDMNMMFFQTDLISAMKPKMYMIKPANENFCYLIDTTGNKKKYFYHNLSWEDRRHWTFPDKWRCKWLESTEWDSLNKPKDGFCQ